MPDLAVCDPLAQQFRRLPPIPGDLLASVQAHRRILGELYGLLVPASGYEEEDATSFRVIAMVNFMRPPGFTRTVVAFIFSSVTGHWSAGSPFSRDALSKQAGDPPSYAYGSFYWKLESRLSEQVAQAQHQQYGVLS